MEFPAHIVFSCLLVCQPAIFIDSKRDGTGAAHGRKGFRMKRAELMSGMKVKELMDSLKGDCYRFRVHYPEEWEFGLITGATFFGKRGLVLQHGEDDVSSFTLNPSWLSCEDETQRCIMVEIYLEP